MPFAYRPQGVHKDVVGLQQVGATAGKLLAVARLRCQLAEALHNAHGLQFAIMYLQLYNSAFSCLEAEVWRAAHVSSTLMMP